MSPAVLAALVSAAHIGSIVVATLVALGRVRALRAPMNEAGIQRVLTWDNWAGLAAIALFGSGLWRLLGGLDKPTRFYLDSHAFWGKMGLIGVALALEMWPMVSFMRWRIAIGRGRPVDARRAPLFARILTAQLAVYVLVIPTAALMARGVGYRPAPPSSPACAVAQLMVLNCAACHSTGNPQANLDLVDDPHAALVGQPSSAWPALQRVVPGDPASSLLIKKLRGTQGAMGNRMPLTGALTDQQIAGVEAWVASGAPRCAD